MNIKITIKCLIGLMYFGVPSTAPAQKSLTQIDFYQFASNAFEETVGIDTFSYIAQIIPVLNQQSDVRGLEHYKVFEDRVENDVIRVEYRTTQSDFSKRKVDFAKQTIDGSIAYGHDGFDAEKLTHTMLTHISSLSITVNNTSILVDPKLYRNFFSAQITKVLRVLNCDMIILQVTGGDGAGSYQAFLMFSANGLVGKYLNKGDMYFVSSPDYFSKTQLFDYDILCHYDEWAYFPQHELTSFQPKSNLAADTTALSLAKEFDFSSLIMSDTLNGDYGRVMSPSRNEPIQFFISRAIKSKIDPLRYSVLGVMKDGNKIHLIAGEQNIKRAKFENKEQGVLTIHGSFVLQSEQTKSSAKIISGVWTYHIRALKNLPSIGQDEVRNVRAENIFKTYSGVMKSTDLKNMELTKWGNATAVHKWYGPATDIGWWNVQKPFFDGKGD